jgi:hypothetical protein
MIKKMARLMAKPSDTLTRNNDATPSQTCHTEKKPRPARSETNTQFGWLSLAGCRNIPRGFSANYLARTFVTIRLNAETSPS